MRSCASSRRAARCRSSARRAAGRTACGRTSIRRRRRSSSAAVCAGARRRRREPSAAAAPLISGPSNRRGRATAIMSAMRVPALLVLALGLALAPGAPAQQDAEGARGSIAAVEALLKDRPNDATLYFYLARSNAEAGNRGASLAALEKALELGE